MYPQMMHATSQNLLRILSGLILVWGISPILKVSGLRYITEQWSLLIAPVEFY